MKSLVPGLVTAAVLGVVVGALVLGAVLAGAYNTAASYPHLRIVHHVLHTTFKNAVWWRAPDEVPADLNDEGRVLLGAQHYANACAKCHGGPGLGQNPQALALRPRPQHLVEVVDQFSDAELHFILQHGVRMSGMPSWPSIDRDDEVWNVVAFLRQLPEMTAEDYTALLADRDLALSPEIAYVERGETFDNGIDDGPGQTRWPEEEYGYFAPSTEWRDFAVQGDVVQRCAACHGPDGSGNETLGRAPNLTVLSADYITDTLRAYASGERKSGIMQIVATNLSEVQRRALGEYYAALPDVPAEPAVTGDVEIGREIATTGKPLEAVPACVTCHNNPALDGTELATLDPPNLAGQSPIYIEQQLRLFATGVRESGSHWTPMGYIASNMSPEEWQAVAAYFASEPPGAEIAAGDLLADADPEAGLAVVQQVCGECHTEAGIGSQSGDVPNLTLQTQTYMHQQLMKFRHDIRPSSRMGQTAKQQSVEELTNAAAFYTALPPVRVERDIDPALAEAGAGIAQEGLPDRDVPACVTCHGVEPTSALALLPRLHGQNYAYLNERLDQFAGDSGNDLYAFSPMHEIAGKLTGEEREAVAAWFATRQPLAKDGIAR